MGKKHHKRTAPQAPAPAEPETPAIRFSRGAGQLRALGAHQVASDAGSETASVARPSGRIHTRDASTDFTETSFAPLSEEDDTRRPMYATAAEVRGDLADFRFHILKWVIGLLLASVVAVAAIVVASASATRTDLREMIRDFTQRNERDIDRIDATLSRHQERLQTLETPAKSAGAGR